MPSRIIRWIFNRRAIPNLDLFAASLRSLRLESGAFGVVSELPNVCLGNSSPTIVPVAFLLVTLQRGGSRCLASQEMILRF